ncbi:myosin-binding protein C, slow-type-like [Amphibalanus amphitrite]|uniref:myosin-binding protein C, slow-type-like n=1 Tax=Amphibalanus amphitrite TaxID=1232801 RepID=UPI001C915382|nr:myosin-binding protein C, slow-type-like [Amphibalanus amphitrite]
MANGDFLLVVIVSHLLRTGYCSPLTPVSVKAGNNATLPCPALSAADASAPGDYRVNQLVWSRCSGKKTCLVAGQSSQLVTYAGGKVSVQQEDARLSLDLDSWSLVIDPARATDSGVYSCVFNKQASERNIVQLLVLDVPSPPGRPMVLRHESRLVNLSWAPSKYTNNAPIEYYVVQTR